MAYFNEREAAYLPLIRVRCGESERRIPARVMGHWALHPAENGGGGWSVTHVPSGKAVNGFATRDSAEWACIELGAADIGEDIARHDRGAILEIVERCKGAA
ncbi:MAG: hypothetical protein EA351_00370 [Gemmatimonadales bacterium]|nr:MAG: hypothetical protein EA351_00370 [Gemmatimonadales bacterium]